LCAIPHSQPQLVRELGAIVRNQVPAARRSVLGAYGEVLFRAWRDAAGACALEVEALIQARNSDLAHACMPALHAVGASRHPCMPSTGVHSFDAALNKPAVSCGAAKD
jgi:hypothetical protein